MPPSVEGKREGSYEINQRGSRAWRVKRKGNKRQATKFSQFYWRLVRWVEIFLLDSVVEINIVVLRMTIIRLQNV